MALIGNVQVAVLAVLFIVAGVMAVGYLQANVPTADLSTEAQTQINNTFSQGYTALKLLGVGLIFLGIGAMIAILLGAFGGGGRR